MDQYIYISLTFPRSFDVKLLENVTFDISTSPPKDCVEVKPTLDHQKIACNGCTQDLSVRVYVQPPPIESKPEEINLPALPDIKTEDYVDEDSFDFTEAFEPKIELEELKNPLLNFNAESVEDITSLYEKYGRLNIKENPFTIGDQKLFWERARDTIYFSSVDLTKRKCDVCSSTRRTLNSLAKHRVSHYANKDACRGCSFESTDREILFKHSLLCTATVSDPPEEYESFGGDLDGIYRTYKRKARSFPFYDTLTTFDGVKLHFYQLKSSYLFYMMNFDPRGCKCDICGMDFKTVASLIYHRRYHFFETGDTECAICKQSFDGESTLARHSLICPRKWDIKPLTCKFCTKPFASYEQQRKHEIGHRKGWDRFAKPRMCHLCSKVCDDTANLRAHLRKVHEIDPFRCDHCPKFFGDLPQLKFHLIEKHFPHLAQFPCPKCTKVFPIKNRLDSHVKNRHAEGKPSCQHCGRTFQNLGSLRTHIESIHTHFSERKKFCCETCGKVFFTKYALQSHTLTHMAPEDWPFQCKVCDKKFVNKYKWSDHEKAHLNGPQNVCNYCGKSFHTKIYLADHINLHTGNKPYDCKVCQKRFSDRGNLRSHLKNHEKNMGVKLVLTPEERRLVRQRVVNSETILSK